MLVGGGGPLGGPQSCFFPAQRGCRLFPFRPPLGPLAHRCFPLLCTQFSLARSIEVLTVAHSREPGALPYTPSAASIRGSKHRTVVQGQPFPLNYRCLGAGYVALGLSVLSWRSCPSHTLRRRRLIEIECQSTYSGAWHKIHVQ